TAPGMILASAASTLLSAMPWLVGVGCRADMKLRLATALGDEKQAAAPGWLMASPAMPCPERPSVWLLLKIYCEPLRFHRLPNVPTQQAFAVKSCEFPPVTPNCIGSVCTPPVLLG